MPCIGSIAIPRSTSYTTDVTFFTKIQRFHETPISSLEEHQFQESLRNKDPCTPYRLEMRADSLSSTAVISHLSRSTSSGFSLSYMYVTGTMCFLLQVKCTPKCPDSKEGQISLQRHNAGSSFISQDERMTESPINSLQNALSLHLFSIRGLTSLCHLERHAEFSASKFDDA